MKGQGFGAWIIYVAIRTACALFWVFPIDWNLPTARLLGWLWCRLLPRWMPRRRLRLKFQAHRERTRDHIRQALGSQLDLATIDRIALRSMQQLVMMAMESAFMPRLINEWTWAQYITTRDFDAALRVLLRGRGAILLTGHYGNWELSGYLLACWGFDVLAVMRPLDNAYLNRWLVDVRRRKGLRLAHKKGATSTLEETLRDGGLVGFIADQDAGPKGMFVDFFGRPASTYKSIGLLAMSAEVPVIVGYARRTSDRFRYEVGVTRVIEPDEWREQPDPLRWITQEYTAAIEQFVREAPEQYLWMHRRWKHQPRKKSSPASLAASP
ncbi:MAG TPA: lysophospholipid acyltransferase family protein [Phycisphaerae bacterium]|jgi:KDO2-lipid IV(A) lauroyltransferase